MQQGVSKCKYIVGPVERFDQKNEMFKRPRWQPELRQLGQDVFSPVPPQEQKDGYGIRERALQNAAWYMETGFAEGVRIHNTGLYSWESQSIGLTPIPPEFKYEVTDPAQMSGTIKKVARFFGADEVGVCELDPRWVYSHYFHMMTREHGPLEVPSECKYAIAIAVEMDYEMMKTSPAGIAGAATGLGYSRMAFTAALLAEFIRALGYKAIPSGNDTALSIPIAVDAGLGELGRNGLLITPRFGPRVRLAKVLTDMPLVSDPPHRIRRAPLLPGLQQVRPKLPRPGHSTRRPHHRGTQCLQQPRGAQVAGGCGEVLCLLGETASPLRQLHEGLPLQ